MRRTSCCARPPSRAHATHSTARAAAHRRTALSECAPTWYATPQAACYIQQQQHARCCGRYDLRSELDVLAVCILDSAAFACRYSLFETSCRAAATAECMIRQKVAATERRYDRALAARFAPIHPTVEPTGARLPSASPTNEPTRSPTTRPASVPTARRAAGAWTHTPSTRPTASPTVSPTRSPSVRIGNADADATGTVPEAATATPDAAAPAVMSRCSVHTVRVVGDRCVCARSWAGPKCTLRIVPSPTRPVFSSVQTVRPPPPAPPSVTGLVRCGLRGADSAGAGAFTPPAQLPVIVLCAECV